MIRLNTPSFFCAFTVSVTTREEYIAGFEASTKVLHIRVLLYPLQDPLLLFGTSGTLACDVLIGIIGKTGVFFVVFLL